MCLSVIHVFFFCTCYNPAGELLFIVTFFSYTEPISKQKFADLQMFTTQQTLYGDMNCLKMEVPIRSYSIISSNWIEINEKIPLKIV